jgi:hypothetical protein
VARWKPRGVVGAAPADGLIRVSGVVHVHTTLSDGSATPEEVAAAARRAGLRFVILTDHNNVEAKPFEGYHDGVLVLVGTEISTSSGHVLALGVEDPVFRFSGDARDALDDIALLGGTAYAAHPSSPRDDFQWTGWDLPGAWGIELLNGDSQWRAAGVGRLLRTGLLYGLNPRYALLLSLSSPTATLARWDGLLARRSVAGIAGADAHGRIPLQRRFQPRFPSYEAVFELAQNHVLLEAKLNGEARHDTAAILAALERGHNYVGLDALAPADGFFFQAEANGRRIMMGESIEPQAGLRLKAGGRLPGGAQITLLRDGHPLASQPTELDVIAPGPGVYRVEVRVPGWSVPWVISNPIYVFAEGTSAARRQAAARPETPMPPLGTELLDRFDAASSFAAEFDEASRLDPAYRIEGAGPGGGPAARLHFRLGVPTPAHPFVSAALVSRRPRDLTGRRGLTFSVRGDRVYRLWVQVRDQNPASADEGTEWWAASVRTGTEWRRVRVPFESLRSINPRSDGRLDLDKVVQLVFVLDQGAVKPGTEGTIELAELAAY